MNKLKKMGISILYSFTFLLCLTLFFTLLNYFNLISDKFFVFIKFMIPVVSIFIGGIKLGKKSESKGWLEGIKFGLLLIFVILIFSLIFFKTNLNIKSFFYYIILVLVAITSSMIGINFKKN